MAGIKFSLSVCGISEAHALSAEMPAFRGKTE